MTLLRPGGNTPGMTLQRSISISDPRTNDRIRVPEVRLIGAGGEQVGVVAIEIALRMAQEADLDLVEVAPESKPPVAKIMDYGKFKYEAAQKAKEARRNQANTVLKEVRFRLKIDDHDYETKRKRAIGFLGQGDKVKAMILFRGREQSRPEQGVRLLQRFAEDVAEFGSVEQNPMIDGRNMVMVIGPVKSKTDAKAEQNAKRNAAKEAARVARVGDAKSAETKAPATAPVEAKTAAPVEATAPVAPVDSAPVVAPAVEAAPVETAPATSPVDTSTSSAQRPVETAPAAKKPAVAKAPAAEKPTAKAPAAKAAPAKATAAKAPAAKAAAPKAPAAAKPAAAKAPAKPKTEKPAE